MLKAALVHGRPMMVIAITTAAIIQPAAIHRPPKMIHSRFRSTEMADIPGTLVFAHNKEAVVSEKRNELEATVQLLSNQITADATTQEMAGARELASAN